MIEYLRLAFGTLVVLLPGVAVSRALAHAVGGCHLRVVARVRLRRLGGRVHAAPLDPPRGGRARCDHGRRAHRRRRRGRGRVSMGRAPVWLFGIVLGWFLWHVESPVVGDGLFHEARVRKLVDLTSLHLRTVDEFKDGGLHPGYAFPLWHGFLALVSWFSGLDPEQVVRHEPSLLAPLACVVVFEAGVAVFGSRSLGARRGRGAARALLLRRGVRRRVRGALAARHRHTADDGAGGDRAVLRRALAGAATPRSRRSSAH